MVSITVTTVLAMVMSVILLTSGSVATVDDHLLDLNRLNARVNSRRDGREPITMGNSGVHIMRTEVVVFERTTRELATHTWKVGHPMAIG